MDFSDVEIIRNYITDELVVHINSAIATSVPSACIVSGSGETIELFPLSEGENTISLKQFLYKNYSVRVSNKNNVVQYAL